MGARIVQRGQRNADGTRTPWIFKCQHCETNFSSSGDRKCPGCDAWYNAVGQELNPPRTWGEETNERFDDCGHYVGPGYRGDGE